jgi:predicted dehydrogenase
VIRYGIVGVGGFAANWVRWLEGLEAAGQARLAAAVVRDPAKYAAEVERLAARGCRVYPTLAAMLADGGVDVVGVPTGIAQHVPLAAQAMEASYNVLVEKPVAATIQEVRELQEVARRTGRWCAVGFQFIYSPTIQWLRERLASGQLGALLRARVAIGWPRGARYYARNPWAGQLRQGDTWVLDGPATNATAHHLENMLYLAATQGGGAIASVRAELYRAGPIASYDSSCIEVLTEGGARLLHVASHTLEETLEPVMEVECERGSIHWEAADNSAIVRYADGREERRADPDPDEVHARPLAQVARVAAGLDPAPLCGLGEAEPHVLAIDLAFESSGGIATIGPEHVAQGTAGDGSALVRVEGMEGLLRQALASGRMFSELGAPWARATRPVAARGYGRFPGNEALARALGGV